ncbi:hypothetical protein J2Y38_002156 [Flavobacterium sp. 2755]|uniref:hypothetical protein n=1 Tax=Flavobacterium sp. 2755 TaxID=2817765 RepID=UPI002862CF0B|nr:hypothetical protein [Flavobacterium sp. 2755]MDR6761945.1 hypothetical protein [Flavobacterium sp. 2755]
MQRTGNLSAKSLAEESLRLEDFDFNTKLSTLLPESSKSKKYHGYYEIKNELIEVDTVSEITYDGNKKVRIDYRQRSYSSRDTMAKFCEFEFNAINLATDLSGKIILIHAVIDKTDLKQSKDLIDILDKKYGKAKKSKNAFFENNFDIYTWHLKDRIIRYSLVFDKEENMVYLKVDKNNKKIEKIDAKNEHFKGYFYIIKDEDKDKVFGKDKSGDLVYVE